MLTATQQQRLQELNPNSVQFDVSMARYSTLKAGGQAAALVDVGNQQQLAVLLRYCGREHIPWRVIGRGSNILVTDAGFDGIICRLGGEFKAIRPAGGITSAQITAGGGCLLARLLSWCCREGFGGLEFLVGVPGGVGGAVRMNAGAFGYDLGGCLESISIAGSDGEVQEVGVDEMALTYRSCTIDRVDITRSVILAATFQLKAVGAAEVKRNMKNYLSRRKKKQPANQPSAGSFFKNPQGDYAGRLIEAAGLKGVHVGGAMVSPGHANFIVNADGKATATDIVELMHYVQKKVEEHTSIFLEPEVHIF